MTYTIGADYDGKIVLDVLTRELSLSSRTIKHLKYAENGITLCGLKVTVRHPLKTGDVLELAIHDTESSVNITAHNLPVEIAYEDCDIVIPNKPGDMPTHPSRGHPNDTLANALAYRYRDIPFVFRPTGRLDRNTSGLLIAAKNRVTAKIFCEYMIHGRIKKKYTALLEGVLNSDSGVVEKNIRRTADSIITREVCGENDGAYALTSYRVIARSETHTLVIASPVTGRTHQLRVHFSSIGHPISGDDMYGGNRDIISRQALHCTALTFPFENGNKTVFGSFPDDLKEALCRTLKNGADIEILLKRDLDDENKGYF